jgi:hypothetical protein
MRHLRQALPELSIDSLKRGASAVYQVLRVRFVSLMLRLCDVIEPRLQAVLAGIVFILVSLISPSSAWRGMRDVVTGEMVDFKD